MDDDCGVVVVRMWIVDWKAVAGVASVAARRSEALDAWRDE